MNDDLKAKSKTVDGADIISDDVLEGVNGGLGKDYNEYVYPTGKCSHCGSFLKKNGVYYRCTDCRILFDKYGNEIGGDE